MKKLILVAALFVSCGPTNPPDAIPCQLAVECQMNDGTCITCNPGFICGDASGGDVTCVEKSVFGGTWTATATGCPPRMVFDYSGPSYIRCFNHAHQAKLFGCTSVVDNCH